MSELVEKLEAAGFHVDVQGGWVNIGQVRDLLAVCLADEYFGYEADYDRYDGDINGWYCRDSRCSQPFGEPHLDACPHAASIKRVEALRER